MDRRIHTPAAETPALPSTIMRLRFVKNYSKITRWILLLILFPVSWSAEAKQLLPVLSGQLTFLHQPKWRGVSFFYLLFSEWFGYTLGRNPVPSKLRPPHGPPAVSPSPGAPLA